MEDAQRLDGCRLVFSDGGDGSLAVAASGEFDLVNAGDIHRVLGAAVGASNITLDLGRVEFIDSSGLTALLRVAEIARHAGRPLNLVRLTSNTRRLIEITGIADFLGVGESQERRTGSPTTA